VGKISEGLKDADYLVVVLSQASVSSRWVEQELNAALTNQIAGKGIVLPVLLEDCELPMLLRKRLYADFRSDLESVKKSGVGDQCRLSLALGLHTQFPERLDPRLLDALVRPLRDAVDD
jgi:TIR domain-containing protein